MEYKNLNDVMEHLTRLEHLTDHNPSPHQKDVFQVQIDTIANMLKLFNVKWHFIEKDGRFIAKLVS